MLVDAILCPSCDHYVYSCHKDDKRHCPCGDVYMSGGREKTIYSVKPHISYAQAKVVKFRVNVEPEALEYDFMWVLDNRYYGIIEKEEGDKCVVKSV